MRNSYLLSMIVLVGAWGLTGVLWDYSRDNLNVKEETRFAQEIQQTEDILTYRLGDYIEALFGLRSLFASEEAMTARHWTTYCDTLNLRQRVPGVHSLRFHTRVTATQQAVFLEHIRTDASLMPQGAPDFTIFSVTESAQRTFRLQEEAYVVTYVWPRAENQQLYGLDVYSDPIRRLAIDQARDSGEPAASPPIVSFPDDQDALPGFAIYLPVYYPDRPITTVSERRNAIQGVLAARFSASEFFREALRRIRRHPGIDLEIFDGPDLTAAHVLYDDDGILRKSGTDTEPMYQKTVAIDVYGRPWTLQFSSTPDFVLESLDRYLPTFVVVAGVTLSLLLSETMFALTTSQARATHLAQKMTRQLEQQRALSMHSDRLRSLGEMAAGIAHELSQPLVGVRGLAEHIVIAQDRGWNLGEQGIRDKVTTIIEQADRMAHIIEHVRIFAREAGKPELRSVSVNDVVESSVNLLRAQFASHGLRLETTMSPDIPAVLANPFSLEEVVLNLVMNARDAVEERLKSEPELPNPRVLLRTHVISNHDHMQVRIEVTDNGVGISEDIRAKLFDPFFTTKAPDKGTGLGLAISKTIVEEFHGTLSMTSTEGAGTTATITLPAASVIADSISA